MDSEIPFGPSLPKRDTDLIALLPPKNSEYSFDRLSAIETAALEAALADGFRGFAADKRFPKSTPRSVDAGLLRHPFYVRENSEYDPVEYEHEFWSTRTDAPPPSEWFPLGFSLNRLRLYFENQLSRFAAHLLFQDLGEMPSDLFSLEAEAGRRVYEKPWYEFHALQFLDWIEEAKAQCDNDKLKPLGILATSSFSGQLGRLVEQYYWRLRFESAAKTGIGARAGASAGGKTRSRKRSIEHANWQRSADEIWKRKPELTLNAVAELVKAKLKLTVTTKNITRFIKRP